MEDSSDSLQDLFHRWQHGDREALDVLLVALMPTIEQHVHRRLGPRLRRKEETLDCVQETLIKLLNDDSKREITDVRHLISLISGMVEQTMCDKHDHYKAQKRSISRERPLARDSRLGCDPPRRAVDTPSAIVDRDDREGWIKRGLALLDSEDRWLIVERQWKGRPFADLGHELGITADAARMRHNKAVSRLGEKVWSLRRGAGRQAPPG